MPAYGERTNTSDALEYAMLLLLILIFTPLAFTYFFVWLLYPLVIALRLVLRTPMRSLKRTGAWVWFWACVFFISLTLPLPFLRPVQAAGSTLMACLLLIVGIGWSLRAETRNRSIRLQAANQLDGSTDL
jgi:hypothetical protein